MADSTAMTIDFLRARLLSERSVSKAARERADLLAKRVVELEEQLRIVSLQRRKAEKAAAEVLAILEARGICDFAEAVGSSSDQDDENLTPTKAGGGDAREGEETSAGSKAGRSEEVEDAMSGSESGTPNQAGMLTWKGRSTSPDSRRKQKAKHFGQKFRPSRYLSYPDESSPKYQLGKSCRKVKQKEFILRAASDDKREEPGIGNDFKEGEAAPAVTYDMEGSKEDSSMERVLEEQAQLIGRFEAEEDAQRAWEKEYNKSRNPTTASLDETSVQLTIQDSKEDASAAAADPPVAWLSSPAAAPNGVTDFTQTNADDIDTVLAPAATNSLSTVGSSSDNEKFDLLLRELVKGRTDASSVCSAPEPNHGMDNHLAIQLYQSTENDVENALQALQNARISLNRKARKRPAAPNHEILAICAPEQPDAADWPSDGLKMTFRPAGLFRLPTDSLPTTSAPDFPPCISAKASSGSGYPSELSSCSYGSALTDLATNNAFFHAAVQ